MNTKKKIILISIILVLLFNLVAIAYLALNQSQPTQATANEPSNKALPNIHLADIQLPKLFPTQHSETPKLFLLNFWGTWCSNCHLEHPTLVKLAKDLPIIGVNWYDAPGEAEAYLQKYGNPYQQVFFDEEGQYAVNLGVVSAPESFLVNDQGDILWHRSGVLKQSMVDTEILPRLKALK